MRHFISFQKKKGIFVIPTLEGSPNESLAHSINHELMNTGYILNKDIFDALSNCTEDVLTQVYTDLMRGIKSVTGGGGYEPIYRNFPQSVLQMDYEEFVINAIIHYWTWGTWRPEDAGHLDREFRIEPTKFKPITLLVENEFNSIFTSILYSGKSISKFDKDCIDYWIDSGKVFEFNKITFKETLSYVGQRLMDSNIDTLPTKNATNVLRIWSAYSGGDEGLKENTRFKNPNSKQRRILMNTLNDCYNLEDSFKAYREKWLRLLHYLHPMTKENMSSYPILGEFTVKIRNNPKSLLTFNAKVEKAIAEKDTAIFDLLARRKGVFTRRLDHLIRVFGVEAFDRWIELDGISTMNLVTAYNHFTDRDKKQEGRSAILASQSQSQMVQYTALEPLSSKLVSHIKTSILDKIRSFRIDRKVYIDRSLYYTPINMNNRASSLSLDSKAIGGTEVYTEQETLRMYVHWQGRTDIDLSGFVIDSDNNVTKVGWNGNHKFGNAIVYSGDNTGYSTRNAEYLDINTKSIPNGTEWIIVEARIYSGPRSFAGYNGKCRMGWMSRKYPEANDHWLPKTIENARIVNNSARTAYLMAYHPATKNVVYLDMAMGSQMVSTAQDAMKMRMFLESFVVLDDGSDDINWNKLNLGHILNLTHDVVEAQDEATVVFDENTNMEEITSLIT